MLLASNHHHQQQQQYHGPALPMMPTPLQVRRRPVFEFDDEHLQNQKPTIPMELQIVSSQQHFRLPDGWVVEKKPRPSHESRFDKVGACFAIYYLLILACMSLVAPYTIWLFFFPFLLGFHLSFFFFNLICSVLL